MKNQLIDFLSAYGPVANGQNMYDEFVVSAAKEAGVKPLEIEETRSAEIIEILQSDNPRTVILTGTAGDGKTFTARKVLELISNGTAQWTNDQAELSITCETNGQKIIFVKDLSEVRADEKKKLMPRVVASLFQNPSSDEIFVLCVNDGHLLKTWRENAGNDPQAEKALATIQKMLRDDLNEVQELNIKLFNMSRTSHAATIDRIIDAITGHPAWNQCTGCSGLNIENPCPIRVNREILERIGPESVRARLRSLIEIAAADDSHLSIRQIMILVINALLGDQKQGAPPLLDCNRAQRRCENNEYAETNLYSNLFGENYPPNRQTSIQAFETLARFAIGDETNNFFDDALLDPDTQQQMPEEDRYGSAIFDRIRIEYRERPEDRIAVLRPAIKAQRRRLFFLMPEVPNRDYRDVSPWYLTTYHRGDIYINLLRDAVESDESKYKAAQRDILKGINRTLTGALTETSDALWLTQPSGVYLGSEKPLLVFEPIRWRGRDYWLELKRPRIPGRPPRLEIHLRGQDDALSSLDLTPTLFEYLVRVSRGALPTSFSNQCYQDIRNFQIRSVGAILKTEKTIGAQIVLKAVDTSGEQLIALPIDILEDAL